jgi:hypothetical protein
MEQKANDFQHIITGDELWSFLFWPPDELPQRIEHKIDAEKCLISILWSVHGFYRPLDGPKGTTYNTALFTDAVMPSLI